MRRLRPDPSKALGLQRVVWMKPNKPLKGFTNLKYLKKFNIFKSKDSAPCVYLAYNFTSHITVPEHWGYEAKGRGTSNRARQNMEMFNAEFNALNFENQVN